MKNLRKTFLLLVILFFTLSGSIFTSEVRRRVKRKMPAILIRDNANKYTPLGLHEIKINIKVVGNIATTTTEMTFYNDMDRVLEGQLYFPLSEGQTVSRFALDIRGKMREGVIVSKAKGRKVFESTVRSMIDPGLLEWTKGNNFKSRIYPIPARGYKKLLIAYEQELNDNGRGFLYRLPLAYKQRVKKFSLKVEVVKQRVKPVLGRENELVNFRFRRWRESYIASRTMRNYIPGKSLVFQLPKTRLYKKVVIERDRTGRRYFYIHLTPKKLFVRKRLPKKVCLIWDASDSGKNKNIKKELNLLGKYFKRIGNLRVNLVVFRNDVNRRVEKYSVRRGRWNRLYKRLKNIRYDGATQLGALNLKKYKCNEFIISTDGVSNFGRSEIKLAKTPVYVINSKLTASHSYLKYIAQKTGGQYINLAELTLNQGLNRLVSQPFAFLGAVYNRRNIAQTYPSIPTTISNDFSIAGILKKPYARIKLNFGVGNKVKYTKTIVLNYRRQAVRTGLVKRIWAQKKIAQLDIRYKKNEKKIIAMGKKYSIVTRYTSLIVLDRIQDYVTHRILPPRELRREYLALVEKAEKILHDKIESNIERVAKLYAKLRKWWNKQYPMGNPPASVIQSSLRNGRRRRSSGRTMDSMRRSRPRPSGMRERSSGAAQDIAPRAANGGRAERRRARRRNGDRQPSRDRIAGSSITLRRADPNTPYIKKLKDTNRNELYVTYLKFKKEYSNSSAFFLDVSDFFIRKGMKRIGLRVLSNIAEMELENHQLLRILGHRLSQLGYNRLAAFIFREVLKIREEEPQSYRDLALVYSRFGKYQKAVNLLYEVIKKRWDKRFPEIEVIAAHEMNSIISRSRRPLKLSHIDRRLIKKMPVDVRVVLNWDMDNTDMDLWVFDPNKEKCYYRHRRTYVGGYMSRDFTRGYGPEIYMIRAAKAGKYKVKVKFYGHRQQVLAGATTIQVQLFLNYGRRNQRVKEITLRLKKKKQIIDIGSFTIIRKRSGEITFK